MAYVDGIQRSHDATLCLVYPHLANVEVDGEVGVCCLAYDLNGTMSVRLLHFIPGIV